MKNVMLLATMTALTGILMVGCASNKAGNPVAAWQSDRYNAEEIAKKNTAAKPVTLQDVMYKSAFEEKAFADPINALAPVPAAMYLKVVTAVDKMAAEQDGRLIYIGVQNDIANGANVKELLAQMTPEQKTAYLTYQKSIAQVNQDSIINNVVLPMISQIATESAKVAPVVAQIKSNPKFAALAGLALMQASKTLVTDGDALGQQFSDTTAGANLWLELLKKDKEAKAFMQEYPIQ